MNRPDSYRDNGLYALLYAVYSFPKFTGYSIIVISTLSIQTVPKSRR